MPRISVNCLSTIATENSADIPFSFDYPEREISVRALIVMAVREQCAVRAAAIRRPDAAGAQSPLTAAAIGAQAAKGAVKFAPRGLSAPDPANEVAKALAGFEQGAFIVLVGGTRCETLDQAITLNLVQQVQFVRMVPLVGG